MTRLSVGFGTALLLVWSGTALAQAPAPAAPGPAAPAPAAPAATPAPAAPAPAAAPPAAPARKSNPPGTGPFWDAVIQGDSAYAARDFEGAIKAYRTAIEKDPNNPMGHYRLGETQLAKGDLVEAEASWQAGLRHASKDAPLRAKLLFRLADLRERTRKHDDALAQWKEYATHAQANPDAKAFPATAAERQKRLNEWKQLSADSLAVKERIEKRLKETEESMRKSSK